MIARKTLKNYWLVISLFIGILVTIALVSSIPIYTTGSLQNLVVSESQRYQEENGNYPGIIKQALNWKDLNAQYDRVELLEQLENTNEKILRRQVEMPRAELGTMLTSIVLQGERDSTDSKLKNVYLSSLSGFEENIKLVQGKEPDHSKDHGAFEVYVHDRALLEMDLFLGEDIRLSHQALDEEIIVRPVGTFQAAEQTELYWPESPERFDDIFILADDVFREHLLPLENFVNNVLIYSIYDYSGLDINDAFKLDRKSVV